MLLVTAARAAGGSDNITAIVADVAGDRLAPPKDDDDLPTFREFDPQKEGDPALTDTSYVARRLAARIGLPIAGGPAVDPGHRPARDHASRASEFALPATALPIEDIEGPARRHLGAAAPRRGWWSAIAIVACAIAWVLGGR